jgi:hypothetical protein
MIENPEPPGTVRRNCDGTLATRTSDGWRLMSPENDTVLSLTDVTEARTSLRVPEWPIIWSPDANFHEQDNIRRAQGEQAGQA